MEPYFAKTPKIIQNVFSDFIWRIATDKKEIYLTFDDGPIPEITDWVLKTLDEFNIKATFFCVGDNIRKYPKIFQSILQHNHAIGNHTFNHLNGWRTNTKKYLDNVEKAEDIIAIIHTKVLSFGKNIGWNKQQNLKIFRPPYGKIRPSQRKALQKKGYQIIMWDVLSADFDQNISKEKCLKNVVKSVENGS
ncbi:MAG: polysaccharide deacetylase family protein, partial [Flavobacteriaceae bacterium]|nr:polysaccharide deacetylase family protein [Flavobacteriaceae bacterium]